MIWKEAALVLRAAGLEIHERSFGLEGVAPEPPAGFLRYQLGRSSDGGCELSIRSSAGPPVRWFVRPSVASLVALLLDARGLVDRGESASLLAALVALEAR